MTLQFPSDGGKQEDGSEDGAKHASEARSRKTISDHPSPPTPSTFDVSTSIKATHPRIISPFPLSAPLQAPWGSPGTGVGGKEAVCAG